MGEQVLPRIAARRGGGAVVRAQAAAHLRHGRVEPRRRARRRCRVGRRHARLPHRLPGQLPAPGGARAERRAGRGAARRGLRRDPPAPRPARVRRGRGDACRRWWDACCASRARRSRVAESCTGGLVAEQLTEVPGASAYFKGGVVAYANAAKTALLGVSAALLEQHGAVSDEVARAMAEGAARASARTSRSPPPASRGPDGGTPEKPVGLVHVALARAEGTHADRFVFPLDRVRHRQLSAQPGPRLGAARAARRRAGGSDADARQGGARGVQPARSEAQRASSATHPRLLRDRARRARAPRGRGRRRRCARARAATRCAGCARRTCT